eukprot:scaffold2962_cov169-Amphora_coffeaeformis.AAC.3
MVDVTHGMLALKSSPSLFVSCKLATCHIVGVLHFNVLHHVPELSNVIFIHHVCALSVVKCFVLIFQSVPIHFKTFTSSSNVQVGGLRRTKERTESDTNTKDRQRLRIPQMLQKVIPSAICFGTCARPAI